MVMINEFIFNKLDFQNFFLTFSTVKLCMNIKLKLIQISILKLYTF